MSIFRCVGSLITCLVIQLSFGCSASGPWSDLEGAERAFNRRQKEVLLNRMSLNTIFPDRLAARLAKAAGRGDVATVRRLVNEGADVNYLGKSNGTALYWAFRKKNIEGFRSLLELGANPNVEFGDGGTIVHRASQCDVVGFDNELLRLALEFGGSTSMEDRSSGPPLASTITLNGEEECLSAARLLLDAGANAKATERGGISLIHSAVLLGRFDIATELLVRGADPYLKKSYRPYSAVDDFYDHQYNEDFLSSRQKKMRDRFAKLLQERGMFNPREEKGSSVFNNNQKL